MIIVISFIESITIHTLNKEQGMIGNKLENQTPKASYVDTSADLIT
jgi:hypothetical protein